MLLEYENFIKICTKWGTFFIIDFFFFCGWAVGPHSFTWVRHCWHNNFLLFYELSFPPPPCNHDQEFHDSFNFFICAQIQTWLFSFWEKRADSSNINLLFSFSSRQNYTDLLLFGSSWRPKIRKIHEVRINHSSLPFNLYRYTKKHQNRYSSLFWKPQPKHHYYSTYYSNYSELWVLNRKNGGKNRIVIEYPTH